MVLIRKKPSLVTQIFIAVVLAVIAGMCAPHAMKHTAIVGVIFLRLLKMVVIPLVMCSMILAVTRLGDIRKAGRVGLQAVCYFLATTALAVVLGMVLVQVMQPGAGVSTSGLHGPPDKIKGKETTSFSDLVLSLFSPNLFESMVNFDLLPLIMFSLFFGCVLSTMGDSTTTLRRFFEELEAVIMKLVHYILLIAPIGIFGLIAGKLGEQGGDLQGIIRPVAKYVLTVLLGLGIHGVAVLPLLLFFFGKRNPVVYTRNLSEALLTAFSTASSTATLPVSLRCSIEKNAIKPTTANFVLPLGATINMDGTALYEAVAAIFMAQAYGLDLHSSEFVAIFLTATLASIGAAGIPEAGLVTMVIVLQAVNIPLEGIGLILAVDWFLDRFRTAINVWGDCIGCSVIDRLSGSSAAT